MKQEEHESWQYCICLMGYGLGCEGRNQYCNTTDVDEEIVKLQFPKDTNPNLENYVAIKIQRPCEPWNILVQTKAFLRKHANLEIINKEAGFANLKPTKVEKILQDTFTQRGNAG